jgi:hypothetical protein
MGVLSLRFRGANARRFPDPGFKREATLAPVPPIPLCRNAAMTCSGAAMQWMTTAVRVREQRVR